MLHFLYLIVCLWLFAASDRAVSAEPLVTSEGRLGRVNVALGKSQILKLPSAFGDVVVGSSEIADVLPVSDRSIYVLGKQIGTTSVTAFDPTKKVIGIVDVEVTPDIAFIQSRIRGISGASTTVRVSHSNGRIVLTGKVADMPTAARLVEIASPFSNGPVINAMQIASPQQVLLEVRVIEVNRTAAKELGVNLDGTDKGTPYFAETGRGNLLSNTAPFGTIFTNLLRTNRVNLDMTIQALEQKGLARRLASPNLTALSGSTANFLAGGEFPVPVNAAMNGYQQVTIAFREFGVKLQFTPTVLEHKTINLRLHPEVSDLDFSRAVNLGGVRIPARLISGAATEVTMKSGQSFAIAGLLQQTSRTDAAQLPWIADVPIIGTLFRSQSYQRNETELVIIVTAHLARPAAPGDKLDTPLSQTRPASEPELFLTGKPEQVRASDPLRPQERGLIGHIFQ